MASSPTLDEMLVGGSAASGLLSSLFVLEQQPHTVSPVSIEPDEPQGPNGGGHRRAQANGGGAGAQQANSVAVTVHAQAPTADEASSAVRVVVDRSGGTAASCPTSQTADGNFEVTCTVTLSKAEAEAQVGALWQETPAQERIMASSPTLDEMLVGESAASGMLSSLFVAEQQPHIRARLGKGADETRLLLNLGGSR